MPNQPRASEAVAGAGGHRPCKNGFVLLDPEFGHDESFAILFGILLLNFGLSLDVRDGLMGKFGAKATGVSLTFDLSTPESNSGERASTSNRATIVSEIAVGLVGRQSFERVRPSLFAYTVRETHGKIQGRA